MFTNQQWTPERLKNLCARLILRVAFFRQHSSGRPQTGQTVVSRKDALHMHILIQNEIISTVVRYDHAFIPTFHHLGKTQQL